MSQIRGSPPLPQCNRSNYCYSSVLLEVKYIVLPLTIATGFAVMLYMNEGYGLADPWCWVQSLNETCKLVGLVPQMHGLLQHVYGMWVLLV